MMEILRYPDPRLTQKNERLGGLTIESLRKVQEMRELLAKIKGAGLAAPQVGWNVQLFIFTSEGADGSPRERIIFDPEVTLQGEKVPMPEGCLSFPGMNAMIERHEEVRLVGQAPEGLVDEVFGGLDAQVVQHEMDHLQGMLFIDRMTPADRKRNALALRGLEERWKRRRHSC